MRRANTGGPFDELPSDPPVSVPQRFIEVVRSNVDNQDDNWPSLRLKWLWATFSKQHSIQLHRITIRSSDNCWTYIHES